ncbi:C2 domain present in smad ubiquitination-related factor (smurf)-like protein, putative, partial [Rhizoctonia solani AG-3 Rhs1AP]
MSDNLGSNMKKIRINVVAADGLAKRDLFGLPDPFAVITVDNEQTHSTSSIKKTINPYWNENFDVTVTDWSDITIQVFDQRRYKRRDQGFLGSVNIRVSEVIDLELGGREMLTLELKSNDNLVVHGKLILSISTDTSSPITNSGPTYVPETTDQASTGQPSSASSETPNPVQTASTDLASTEDQLGPLPIGWERRRDHLGRTYFVDHNTHTTTWKHPISNLEVMGGATIQDKDELGLLPLGWEHRKLPTGRTDYLDHNTHTTTWDRPSSSRNETQETDLARDKHNRRISEDDPHDVPGGAELEILDEILYSDAPLSETHTSKPEGTIVGAITVKPGSEPDTVSKSGVAGNDNGNRSGPIPEPEIKGPELQEQPGTLGLQDWGSSIAGPSMYGGSSGSYGAGEGKGSGDKGSRNTPKQAVAPMAAAFEDYLRFSYYKK